MPTIGLTNMNDSDPRGPLTEADLREHWPQRRGGAWPSCSGPCDQGRKLCPSPDACRITPQRRKTDPGYVRPGVGRGALLPAILLLAIVLLAALFADGRLLP